MLSISCAEISVGGEKRGGGPSEGDGSWKYEAVESLNVLLLICNCNRVCSEVLTLLHRNTLSLCLDIALGIKMCVRLENKEHVTLWTEFIVTIKGAMKIQ